MKNTKNILSILFIHAINEPRKARTVGEPVQHRALSISFAINVHGTVG
jgi:hypothetical protein